MSLRCPFFLAVYLITMPLNAKARTSDQVIKPQEFSSLERAASTFAKKTEKLEHSPNCIPTEVDRSGKIVILYNFCSKAAFARDDRGSKINDNFEVPQGIARRFNFWRRIYSIWSKEQYLLHVAEYPEVIIAAFDGTHLSNSLSPEAREERVKKTIDQEKAKFRKLLLAMHQLSDDEDRFTPAMQRIADQMRHINDKDKFKVAAENMRIQRGQREFIEKGLAVAPKYLPAIEREFIKHEIPVEISRLTFVESSFNLQAVSKVGASGVFQIMPKTGRQYLKIANGIDERNDPIKAASAACKLLKLNYKLTESWPLAITAYNHGVGGIRRAIQATGSNDLITLINEYDGPGFGFASKNFYAGFLGLLATLNDSDRLFPNVKKSPELIFDTVRLKNATSISMLRKRHNISLLAFVELNPDISRSLIRADAMLPAGYVLKIPRPNSKLKDRSPSKNSKAVASQATNS